MQNKYLKEDIDYIVSNNRSTFEQFSDKNILITGSTGLIGSYIIKTLLQAKRLLNINFEIFGLARSKDKVANIFSNRQGINFIYGDIKNPILLEDDVDYIFHTAAVTNSKQLITQPVEIFESQIFGMSNLLHFARQKNAKVVYLSSMEIYGNTKSDHKVSEDELGCFDTLEIRNGYPESKRCNEYMGFAFSKEYNVDFISARLSQTFGPGVSNNDSRVFAEFIRLASADEDIVLKTDGLSMGNYTYLRDTIEAILILAIKGKSGEAYNIVNEKNTMNILQLARVVAETIGSGANKVRIDIPVEDQGYALKSNLRMSSKKINDTIGWSSSVELSEMVERTKKSWE